MSQFGNYDPKSRWAVTFHAGTADVPDGWPATMRELRPAFAAGMTDDGRVKLPAIPQEEMSKEEAAAGCVVMTGAQIVALRKPLEKEHSKTIARIEEERRVEREHQDALDRIDSETRSRIASGFEFKGRRFSLSEKAQANILRFATMLSAKAQLFPVEVSTLDGSGATFANAAELGAFITAGNLAIDSALSEGRVRKTAL